MSALRIGLTAALAAVAVGCSKPPHTSKVSGTVTYKGQPVKAGTIYLVTDQGQYETALRPDGSYQFNDIPTGLAVVVIETEMFNPEPKTPNYNNKMAAGITKNYSEYDAKVGGGKMAKGGGKTGDEPNTVPPEQREQLAKVYVKIPKKYSNPRTSDLSFTVEPGAQVKDFELMD